MRLVPPTTLSIDESVWTLLKHKQYLRCIWEYWKKEKPIVLVRGEEVVIAEAWVLAAILFEEPLIPVREYE